VQHGDVISGSVFVEGKDWPIAAGQSEEGRRVRFRIDIPNDAVQFDLTITGDRMSGKAVSAKEAGREVQFELTRKVPAEPAIDTSGVWSGTMTGKGETISITIELRQTGNEVMGIGTAKGRDVPLQGEVDGAKLTFQGEGGGDKLRCALIVAPERMSGFAAVEGHGTAGVLDVELTRTARPVAAGAGGVSGQWTGLVDVEDQGIVKRYAIRLRLMQNGNALTGSLVNEDGAEFPLQAGSVQGSRVEFEMDAKGEHVRFSLMLDGDRLNGKSVQSRGGRETSARISAVRRIQ
jgi:hypothetical protein